MTTAATSDRPERSPAGRGAVGDAPAGRADRTAAVVRRAVRDRPAPVPRPAPRRSPLVLLVAAVLAAATVTGACQGDADPAPPTDGTTSAAPTPEAAEIPLEGSSLAPLRWRAGAANDDPAVLAVRRFLALQALSAASATPWEYGPLYGAVATGLPLEVFGEPGPRVTRPDDQLRVGPAFFWVMAVEAAPGNTRRVDVCRDLGWSAVGGVPAQRRQPASPVSLTVQPDPDDDWAWKVSGFDDPAADLVGPQVTQACARWGEGHTSPRSAA
jgi:hypothetical protein